MVDMFASRIYENQPSPLAIGFCDLFKRERPYDREDTNYSVPIGSRFHPERAPLWEEQAIALSNLT